MGLDRPDDFGTTLRAARERKGVSLRDIATHTKISVSVLEALERNDISRLPGGIFSRAFVRAYANEVGLDPEAAIQEFIAQFPHDSVIAGHPRSDKIEDTELFESDRRAASSVLWILIVSVLLAAGVLYVSVARGTSGAPEASAAAAGAMPAAGAAPEAEAGTLPEASATATTGAPAPAVPASAAPPATDSAHSAVRPLDTAPDGGRLTIVLAARRPVWISATADGDKAIGRLLQTGDQERVEVTREMVITVGDAAAVRMTLDGVEARPLGKTGEVVTVRLTPANFKEFLLPR